MTLQDIFNDRENLIGKEASSNYINLKEEPSDKLIIKDITYDQKFLRVEFTNGTYFGGHEDWSHCYRLKNGVYSMTVNLCGSMKLGVDDA